MLLTIAALESFACEASADQPVTIDANSITLGGSAFADAVGLIRINQSAGVANRSSNVTLLSFGLSNARLDTIAAGAPAPLASGIVPTRNRITVGPGALAGATGVIQINQTAGDGNTSRNTFALTVRP